jgi:hypothetical protein
VAQVVEEAVQIVGKEDGPVALKAEPLGLFDLLQPGWRHPSTPEVLPHECTFGTVHVRSLRKAKKNVREERA